MSGINNNNPSLHLNSKRLVQAIPTKEVVEKALDNEEIPASPELVKEVDPDVVSWLALDQHLLLDMKNIKIVSTVKTESAVKADSTQSAGGTKGSGSTGGSGGVVSADGTQSVSGAGVNGGCKTGSTNEASGSGGVVAADSVSSVSGSALQVKIFNAIHALEQGDVNLLIELKKEYGSKIEFSVEYNENKVTVLHTKISSLNINTSCSFSNKNIDINNLIDAINASVFEGVINGKETKDILNKYAEFYKNSLKNQYNYSDDFLGIISYILNDFNIRDTYTEEEITSLAQEYRNTLENRTKKHSTERKYTDEEIDVMVQEYIEILQSQGHYNLNEILQSFTEKINEIVSPNIEDRDITSISDLGFTGYVGSYVEHFIDEKASNMGLSYEEKEAFENLLFKKLGATKITNWSGTGYIINTKELAEFDKNGASSWFDEILDIANYELSKIKHIPQSEVDIATTLNADSILKYGHKQFIFWGNNVLSASNIISNYEQLKLSNDPGCRKFIQMLEQAFDKFECFCDIDKIDVIQHLIELLNKACGKTGKTLSEKTIDKLNQHDIFAIIQDIINSQEFYITNMVNVDGYIDDFSQGSTGDCWLLSAIKALSSSMAGRAIINNQIEWAEDYSSVTVYFAGIDKYIIVTAEEIIEAKMEGRLSSGDEDVLVLELAMQKVYGDIEGDYESTFWSRFIKNVNIQTDKKVNGNSDKLRNWLNVLLKNKQNGKNFAACFNLKSNGDASCSCICADGSTYSYTGGAHAFAITDITSNSVTFVNPWDSATEYTVSWNEFISLGAYSTDTVYF